MAIEALSAKPENQNRPGVTVVTNDNVNEFVAKQMGKEPPKAEESPEAKAAEEHAKVEKEKAERLAKEKSAEKSENDEEIDHPDEQKKGKLNERFSDLTKKRKEAEAKAERLAAQAKTEREAREKAEQEAAALKAKYEPVKTEQDPEPQASQFTDVGEYAKALKEWTADNTRREDAKKAEAERQEKQAAEIAKAWAERQNAFKAKTEDYEKTISESDVKVSDQVRDAILESEVGPEILYHLAKNTEVAEKIAGMTVSGALRALGKLEATLAGGEKKEAKETPKTPIAELSKAPPPISPLKGAGAPVVNLTGSDVVPKEMTYEQWKELRKAGKIK